MPTIRIKVRTIESEEFSIEVDRTATCQAIYDAAAAHAHTEARRLRILSSGRFLDPTHTIASYNIENDHVVHMVQRAEVPPEVAAATQAPSTGATAAAGGAATLQSLLSQFEQQFAGIIGGGALSDPRSYLTQPHVLSTIHSFMNRIESDMQLYQAEPLRIANVTEARPSSRPGSPETPAPGSTPPTAARPALVPRRTTVQHNSIHCDGCNRQPLPGTRWKSVGRMDTDLCDTCFRSGRFAHFGPFVRLENSAVPTSSLLGTTESALLAYNSAAPAAAPGGDPASAPAASRFPRTDEYAIRTVNGLRAVLGETHVPADASEEQLRMLSTTALSTLLERFSSQVLMNLATQVNRSAASMRATTGEGSGPAPLPTPTPAGAQPSSVTGSVGVPVPPSYSMSMAAATRAASLLTSLASISIDLARALVGYASFVETATPISNPTRSAPAAEGAVPVDAAAAQIHQSLHSTFHMLRAHGIHSSGLQPNLNLVGREPGGARTTTTIQIPGAGQGLAQSIGPFPVPGGGATTMTSVTIPLGVSIGTVPAAAATGGTQAQGQARPAQAGAAAPAAAIPGLPAELSALLQSAMGGGAAGAGTVHALPNGEGFMVSMGVDIVTPGGLEGVAAAAAAPGGTATTRARTSGNGEAGARPRVHVASWPDMAVDLPAWVTFNAEQRTVRVDTERMLTDLGASASTAAADLMAEVRRVIADASASSAAATSTPSAAAPVSVVARMIGQTVRGVQSALQEAATRLPRLPAQAQGAQANPLRATLEDRMRHSLAQTAQSVLGSVRESLRAGQEVLAQVQAALPPPPPAPPVTPAPAPAPAPPAPKPQVPAPTAKEDDDVAIPAGSGAERLRSLISQIKQKESNTPSSSSSSSPATKPAEEKPAPPTTASDRPAAKPKPARSSFGANLRAGMAPSSAAAASSVAKPSPSAASTSEAKPAAPARPGPAGMGKGLQPRRAPAAPSSSSAPSSSVATRPAAAAAGGASADPLAGLMSMFGGGGAPGGGAAGGSNPMAGIFQMAEQLASTPAMQNMMADMESGGGLDIGRMMGALMGGGSGGSGGDGGLGGLLGGLLGGGAPSGPRSGRGGASSSRPAANWREEIPDADRERWEAIMSRDAARQMNMPEQPDFSRAYTYGLNKN